MVIKPHTYDHLIFDKEVEIIYWKNKASLTNGAGITGCQYVDRSISIPMHKTQVQIGQRPIYNTSHTEPHRRKSGK